MSKRIELNASILVPDGQRGVLWEAGSLSLMELTLACYVYSPWSPAVSPEVIIILWPELWGMTGSHIPALLACWVHVGLVAIGAGVGQAGLGEGRTYYKRLCTSCIVDRFPDYSTVTQMTRFGSGSLGYTKIMWNLHIVPQSPHPFKGCCFLRYQPSDCGFWISQAKDFWRVGDRGVVAEERKTGWECTLSIFVVKFLSQQ